MSGLFQDLSAWDLLCFDRLGLGGKLSIISDGIVGLLVSSSSCSSSDSSSDTCHDDTDALTLKLIAIGSILVAGVTGIAIPLLGTRTRSSATSSTDGNLFVAAKAFAAGVILATGFVHMLPDASSNLTSSCLPTYPWSKFPFSGFVAMCSALLTLLADSVGTQLLEAKQKHKKDQGNNNNNKIVNGSEGMHIDIDIDIDVVMPGMHAHNHPQASMENNRSHEDQIHQTHNNNNNDNDNDDNAHGHSHPHSHGFGAGHGDDQEGGGRHAVVSQVLELGIVSHSVIIGLSIGVSHSPCVIRPLVAALSFHQFFEGFALGGCISEAKFKTLKTTLMACFFALTTPSGIAVGISVASSYDSDSSLALVVEGILDSVSAGILIYMSLVDLIAADFMSKKMRSDPRLQIMSYFALFLGATMMSSLAIWS